ncbi:MAG: hypothetical protein IJS61_10830 [Firmicutes bacterium]|nr:hypothetical protein [Bacillota bacterium]
MKRAEKKRKQKKVMLMFTLATAAVIVGGMTFAWFSSQDEVTNRLSARADYSVSISEDFTPPENWVPGQEIEKNVFVTNTGSVDAFARVWLEGEFNIIREDAGITAVPASAYTPTELEVGDNDKLKELGYETVTSDGTKYIKLLSTTSTQNDKNQNEEPSEYDVSASGEGDVKALSEVQALQAGGYLAYAPENAKYTYTVNQNKSVDVYYNTTNHAAKDIAQGSVVKVGYAVVAPSGDGGVTTYIAPTNQHGDIDSDTFKPDTTGLYLFRRNMDVNDGLSDKDWEYSGYYYVAGTTPGDGKYYALKTKTVGGNATVYAEGVLNSGAENVDVQTGALTASGVANVKLHTAKQEVITDANVAWTVDNVETPTKLTATLTDGTQANSAKKVAVDVALANVISSGNTKDKWLRVAGDGAIGANGTRDTFYYTNDIEQGDTTAKLVDSVTLAPETKQTAYIAFDFDLNVKMDSVQVIPNSAGNEDYASVKDGWATTGTKAVAQKATTTVGAPEIDNISWTAVLGG